MTTILIVEDSEHDRELYRRYLRSPDNSYRLYGADCTLYEAVSEQEAIDLFTSVQPDCVLLDYHLPDADGLLLIHKLRKVADRPPCIVMITGQGSEGIAVEALRQGVADYIIKDELTRDHLQKTLDHAIIRTRLQRAVESQRLQVVELNRNLTQTLRELSIANQALRQSQQRERVALHEAEQQRNQLQLILDSLPQITWTTQPTGEVTFVNKRGWEYIGNTTSPNEDWKEFIHADDQQELVDRVASAYQNNTVFEYKFRVKQAATGEYRWMLGRSEPIVDQHQQVLMRVGSAVDIHDEEQTKEQLQALSNVLKAKNEELLRVNEDLETFVYMASHDLKSPVNGLEGLLTMFTKTLTKKASPREAKALDMMHTSVHKLKRTLQDLAETAQMQQGIDGHKEATSPADIVQEIQEDLRETIAEQGATLHLEGLDTAVLVSRKNLRSILYNLINNAIKYRHPDRSPEIYVRSYTDQDYRVITVADNGLGLTAEQQQKLFGAFKRFHPDIEGSGVGLYMVKRIIDNHHGRIEVNSEVGQGTTFTVYFPTGDEPTA